MDQEKFEQFINRHYRLITVLMIAFIVVMIVAGLLYGYLVIL